MRHRGVRRAPERSRGHHGRPAAAGVPRLRLGRRRGRRRRGRCASRARPASWRTSRRRWPRTTVRLDRRPAGMGHTRWATHGGPTDANAHPHVDCTGELAVDPQRDHRELRRSCASTSSGAATSSHSETDTEVVAHLLEEELAAGGAGARHRRGPARPCCRELTGAFTLVVTSAARARTRSSPPGATPRWSSASATARPSSPATSPRSSPTPVRRSRSARTRSSSCGADGVTVTDFDGEPVGGPPVPRRLGRERRREGRLPVLHAQGDHRAAAGARRHAAGPALAERPDRARRAAARSARSCATSTRSSSSPAAPPTTPA